MKLSDHQMNKQKRVDHYWKYIYGWILDKCGACNGTGKERIAGPKTKKNGLVA